MTGIEFDFSEVNDFAAVLDQATPKVVDNLRVAVERSAFVGKEAWRLEAHRKSDRHLPGYPAGIDYTMHEYSGFGGGEIFAEVGPSPGRAQGSLGIVEEAPGGVNAKPQRNYLVAEEKMQEDLVRGVLIAVEDGLGGT
ncbi:hypothetical protein [Microbacterium sp. MMO-10]|uniref:hypothetical protein n=1 Tax=Microbacterium sp. MMO-10 TaxID=3081272 RepID=UPI003015B7E7